MSGAPTISLITPTRNQAAFIERTIASVCAQDPPPFEWIVFDAMSTDATPDILARYAHLPWLRVIREPDRGQSDAINKGLRLARGDYTGWLNSDDELLPDALLRVTAALQDNPDAVLVYGGGRKIDVDGTLLKRVAPRPFDVRRLRGAFYILQPAMFFHRETALAAGALDENLAYAMDWELVLRLAERGPVVMVPHDLAALRCYPQTKSETGGWERFAEIARIGRARHGWFDANHLAYQIRRATRRGGPLVRRLVDGVLFRIFPAGTIMVVGWPGESSRG